MTTKTAQSTPTVAKPARQAQNPCLCGTCAAIRGLMPHLGDEASEADLVGMSGEEAKALIRTLSEDYREARRKSNRQR